MDRRALVITLGQLRAHQLTWENFRTNVLDQLQADLAVCVPNDAFFDFTNPFYVNARFRWLVPDAPDLGDILDRIQRLIDSRENWRALCEVPGHWLGRITQSGQEGPGPLHLTLRWFMLDNISAAKLTDTYDRFIITRSDFFYFCPHPPLQLLDSDSLWIPDGEDYGGLCDRHLVVSAANLVASCNLLDDYLRYPSKMRDAMIAKDKIWNIEKVIAFHLDRNGLRSKVRRFPYVMFLVRAPDDPTWTAMGDYIPDLGMQVKYTSELYEASRYPNMIHSNNDWHSFFAAQRVANLLPNRIYTSHGTVLYVDEDSGELRHGSLDVAPENVYFIFGGRQGRIMHYGDGCRHNIFFLADHGTSDGGHHLRGDSAPVPVFFDCISVPAGSPGERTGATNNLVGLRAGGLYLSAEPDGRVTLYRSHCLLWEHFRLIPDPRILMTGNEP